MHLKCLSPFIASLVLVTIIGSVMSVQIEERAVCSEDYTPCTCDSSAAGRNVVCDQVPIQEIKSLFSRITADLASFKLTTWTSEVNGIPADLLGNTRASSISINCSSTSYELTIDDNAFTSSNNVTKSFAISGCYLVQQRNFTFLSGFDELTALNIFNSRNITSFEGLPSQSNLYYIAIVNCRGFDSFVGKDSDVALTGLRILYLYDNDLDDRSTANILSSLATSSIESLEELRLYNNRLGKVPAIVSSFSKLNQLMMENNNIDLIRTRSLAFYGDVSYLHLGNNAIRSIEPSAFGAHNFGTVYLHQNKLTRFESYVFQVMLEGMLRAGYGSVSLYENPIECDCHLSWLIYHKPELVPIVDGGQCSNSTMFTDLNPDALADCPVFTCPPNIDGNFPNPLSCSLYYVCSNGSSVLVECPGGLVFNPAYQLCDWPYNVPTCNP